MWMKLQGSCFFFFSEIPRKSSNLEKDSSLSFQSTEAPERRRASPGELVCYVEFRTDIFEQPIKV